MSTPDKDDEPLSRCEAEYMQQLRMLRRRSGLSYKALSDRWVKHYPCDALAKSSLADLFTKNTLPRKPAQLRQVLFLLSEALGKDDTHLLQLRHLADPVEKKRRDIGGAAFRAAGWLLPAKVRERKVEEWQSELWELHDAEESWYRRLGHVLSIVRAAPHMAVIYRWGRQEAVD